MKFRDDDSPARSVCASMSDTEYQAARERLQAAIAAGVYDPKPKLPKLRIRGPVGGRLWLCYAIEAPLAYASGMSPEGAYNSWHSYQGITA